MLGKLGPTLGSIMHKSAVAFPTTYLCTCLVDEERMAWPGLLQYFSCQMHVNLIFTIRITIKVPRVAFIFSSA
jgi:hypothetical protein